MFSLPAIRRLFATIAVNVSPQCHKKIPPSPVGSGIVRFGRVHWASRRRNLAEINVTLTALALRSIFRASLEVSETGRLRHTTVKRIELSIWLLYSIITAVPAVAVVSLTGLPRIGTWCGAFLMLNVALSDRLRTGEGRTSCRRDFVSRTSGVGPRSVHSERSTRLETF
jgi:hypothetical protein